MGESRNLIRQMVMVGEHTRTSCDAAWHLYTQLVHVFVAGWWALHAISPLGSPAPSAGGDPRAPATDQQSSCGEGLCTACQIQHIPRHRCRDPGTLLLIHTPVPSPLTSTMLCSRWVGTPSSSLTTCESGMYLKPR